MFNKPCFLKIIIYSFKIFKLIKHCIFKNARELQFLIKRKNHRKKIAADIICGVNKTITSGGSYNKKKLKQNIYICI